MCNLWFKKFHVIRRIMCYVITAKDFNQFKFYNMIAEMYFIIGKLRWFFSNLTWLFFKVSKKKPHKQRTPCTSISQVHFSYHIFLAMVTWTRCVTFCSNRCHLSKTTCTYCQCFLSNVNDPSSSTWPTTRKICKIHNLFLLSIRSGPNYCGRKFRWSC